MPVVLSGSTGITTSGLTVSDISSFSDTMELQQGIEKVTIIAGAAGGTVNFDILTSAINYYTSNMTSNVTLNIRGNENFSLDSQMDVGQSLTCAWFTTVGSSVYAVTTVQIDGSTVTPKWVSGITPSGSASGVDIYTFTIVKTASATFTIFGSLASHS